MGLTGRTILITGGSAGIGLAFALKFLELGNEVIVTERRQAMLDEVKARHPQLHTIRGDVADPEQVAAVATQVKAEFPTLDVLMNNAGIGIPTNLREPAGRLDGLMAEMDVNVGGVIRIDRHPHREQGDGDQRFVPARFCPSPCAGSATKAAVHSYTQSLRFQLEDSGVE